MATPAELIDDSRCIDCGVPDGQKLSILIFLFATIAGVSADPTTLMDNARCIDNCIPQGMRLSVLISLLDGFVNGGGGGGGTGLITCGTSDPVAAPVGSCGLFIRTDTGAIWIWDGAQWVFKV